MGTALNLARILASRSAGEGDCCARPAAEARTTVAGKRCPRNALPASVTEPRKMSRREVCFCKKVNFMSFRPSIRSSASWIFLTPWRLAYQCNGCAILNCVRRSDLGLRLVPNFEELLLGEENPIVRSGRSAYCYSESSNSDPRLTDDS